MKISTLFVVILIAMLLVTKSISDPAPEPEPEASPEPNAEPEPVAEPSAEPEPQAEAEPNAEPEARVKKIKRGRKKGQLGGYYRLYKGHFGGSKKSLLRQLLKF